MFSKKDVDNDVFLDLPFSAQALYYRLGLEADDEGFVGNPKAVARTIKASNKDLQLLIKTRYILSFASGVIVIKHWKMNNTIPKDRFHETTYEEEKAMLVVKKNGMYSWSDKALADKSNILTDEEWLKLFDEKEV